MVKIGASVVLSCGPGKLLLLQEASAESWTWSGGKSLVILTCSLLQGKAQLVNVGNRPLVMNNEGAVDFKCDPGGNFYSPVIGFLKKYP